MDILRAAVLKYVKINMRFFGHFFKKNCYICIYDYICAHLNVFDVADKISQQKKNRVFNVLLYFGKKENK